MWEARYGRWQLGQHQFSCWEVNYPEALQQPNDAGTVENSWRKDLWKRLHIGELQSESRVNITIWEYLFTNMQVWCGVNHVGELNVTARAKLLFTALVFFKLFFVGQCGLLLVCCLCGWLKWDIHEVDFSSSKNHVFLLLVPLGQLLGDLLLIECWVRKSVHYVVLKCAPCLHLVSYQVLHLCLRWHHLYSQVPSGVQSGSLLNLARELSPAPPVRSLAELNYFLQTLWLDQSFQLKWYRKHQTWLPILSNQETLLHKLPPSLEQRSMWSS